MAATGIEESRIVEMEEQEVRLGAVEAPWMVVTLTR